MIVIDGLPIKHVIWVWIATMQMVDKQSYDCVPRSGQRSYPEGEREGEKHATW